MRRGNIEEHHAGEEEEYILDSGTDQGEISSQAGHFEQVDYAVGHCVCARQLLPSNLLQRVSTQIKDRRKNTNEKLTIRRIVVPVRPQVGKI